MNTIIIVVLIILIGIAVLFIAGVSFMIGYSIRERGNAGVLFDVNTGKKTYYKKGFIRESKIKDWKTIKEVYGIYGLFSRDKDIPNDIMEIKNQDGQVVVSLYPVVSVMQQIKAQQMVNMSKLQELEQQNIEYKAISEESKSVNEREIQKRIDKVAKTILTLTPFSYDKNKKQGGGSSGTGQK